MSISSLKLRGIRSFGPGRNDAQMIEFHPLTLILGENGSGKTTLIEALKYITAGTEPPHSESRRNFVHDPKGSCHRVVQAMIELEMKTIHNKVARAVREIKLDIASKAPPTVSSFYEIAGSCHSINKQDDWGKTISSQLGVSNMAVLNHILFCHQDNANWFLGESADVKQKFDDILDCQVYKRALKYIKDNRRKLHAHLQTIYANINTASVYVMNKTKVLEQIDGYNKQLELNEEKIAAIVKILNNINANIMSLKIEKNELRDLANEKANLERDMTNIQREISKRQIDLGSHLISSQYTSYDELKTEIEQYETKLQDQQNLLQEKKCFETDVKRKKLALVSEINNLERSVKNFEVMEGVTCQQREMLVNIFKEADIEISSEDFTSGLARARENMLSIKEQNETNKSLEDDASRDLSIKTREFDTCSYDIKMKKKSLDFIEQRKLELKKSSAKGDSKLNPLQNVVENFNQMRSLISVMVEIEVAKSLGDLVDISDKIIKDLLSSNNAQIERLESDAKLAQEEISALEAKMPLLKFDIQEAQQALTQARERLKSSSNNLNKQMWFVRDTERKFEKYDRDCRDLNQADLDSKRLIIESKKQELEEIESSLEKLSPELMDLYRTLEGSKIRFNVLRENRRVRDQELEYSKLKSQLDELDLKMFGKKTLDSIIKEIDDLDGAKAKQLIARSKLEGSSKEVQENIRRAKRFLEDPKLQFAYKNKAKFLGEKVIYEMLIKDADLLYKCFDQSVTRFHNEVLRQINIALDSRWRKVYQGNDVQTIMLVADEESQTAAEKRKYNYHIAMIRNGVQMRMRERSSAGQKALASIIIRIALAELFARDFGVLAFDEPTANLDKANVASLARIISGLVKNGLKKGHNMQWIIITHDESFLKALDQCCSPFYYVIERDGGGYSRIKKHINDHLEKEN